MRQLAEIQVPSKEEKNYVLHQTSFQVKEDLPSLGIEFKTDFHCWATFFVYDPTGALRLQHLKGASAQKEVLHTEQEKSSPTSAFGKIPAGEWRIEIEIASADKFPADSSVGSFIVTTDVEYAGKPTNEEGAVDYWVSGDGKIDFSGFLKKTGKATGARWYKGDFHTHTIYSDGKMSRMDNLISAGKQELDFFVATDHNIVATSWPASENIQIFPGTEVTSGRGHFNLLFSSQSPFEENGLGHMHSEEGINRIIQSSKEKGLISINHPFLTIWKWEWQETNLKDIDTIEICNDPTYADNIQATEQALLAWNLLLNDGYTITGIGGSDSHMRPEERYPESSLPSLIGDPATFVYAESSSADDLKTSIKEGQVTVSREAFINFSAEGALPGSRLKQAKGIANVEVNDEQPLMIQWIVDGKIVRTDEGSTAVFSYDFSENPEEYHWIRADIRYADGSFYGFTNPVYIGSTQPTFKKWGELLKKLGDLTND